LSKLTSDAEVGFKPSGKQDFTYQVTLTDKNGTVTQHAVFAPNRTHQDAVGETLLSPTGWLKVTHQGTTTSERFETDFEQLFHT
ncbi:hypothetical protein NSP34_25690, partial [Salmonella enterica]|nr:hypothetical protein [Salmonella enterica]